MTKAYIGRAALSYIRGGMTNNMIIAIPRAVDIHTNCFPLRLAKSKIDEGSDAWTDA